MESTYIAVEDPIWAVTKGDIDELQDGWRQLAHVCEVQLYDMFPGHSFCQATPDLHKQAQAPEQSECKQYIADAEPRCIRADKGVRKTWWAIMCKSVFGSSFERPYHLFKGLLFALCLAS